MNDQAESTRTRLVEATLSLLATHGAAGATSREIAAAAGVNLQAITYHFGSKDELVARALVDSVRRWVQPARQALEAVDQDPMAALLAAIGALRTSLDDARSYFPAYVEALAQGFRAPAIRSEIVGMLRELRDELTRAITRLRDAGVIADWIDPSAMAGLVVAAGDGFVIHSLLDAESYDINTSLQQAAQLLLAART